MLLLILLEAANDPADRSLGRTLQADLINHATFKAAGIIDHECGTRDMRRINGLWNAMPYIERTNQGVFVGNVDAVKIGG